MGGRIWAAGLVMAAAMAARAQDGRVSFEFERVGLETPHYTMVVSEDGKTKYHAELTVAKAGAGKPVGEASGPTPGIEREFAISAPTTAKIFELARAADRFRRTCESGAKNIAFTGKKTLRYAGTDGTGECTYNYSEVKPVMMLTEIFLAIEATLESGRRMDFKRRFDRLGLDAEMITLGNLVEGHQASNLETIVPTLRAVANDTELLQRVRSRAEGMLRRADAER